MTLKTLLLSAVAALALGGVAAAQVNTVPQVGLITSVLKKNTYESVALSLPPAASATDIACIKGSATKTIKIRHIGISGTAGTLVTAPFTLLRRAAADTGGTAATTTANWANNLTPADTTDPAATATLISYSANPTINDTAPTYIRSRNLTLPTTAAGTVVGPIEWDWNNGGIGFNQEPTLRGAAQQLCVNLNATSVTSGLLQLTIEWTEE